jgi:hypothetical protein
VENLGQLAENEQQAPQVSQSTSIAKVIGAFYRNDPGMPGFLYPSRHQIMFTRLLWP